MDSGVRQSVASSEFPTPERCHILEVANDIGDAAVSIVRARVPAGITTQLHRLNGVDERYLITKGAGRVEINGEAELNVGEGSVVRIPAGQSQCITNTGQTDLIFWCICTPRFYVGSYEALE